MGYSVQCGCGKDICIYARKRIDKFHQCCTVGSQCLVRLVCKSEVGLLFQLYRSVAEALGELSLRTKDNEAGMCQLCIAYRS